MVLKLKRPGRAGGAGFYEYPKEGRKFLWPELSQHFSPSQTEIPYQDMKDRILFIQALETVRCLQEGVLTSSRDANIGSIMGIGFPRWTGGAIQFINQYGLPKFIARSRELEKKYGARFAPPALLLDKAQAGQQFE
jgi:3-hydroxyacyl-CoA dehydrogenase/enoyl-CoA hydratase/3-hydroxybutyryl-CoA epimerase